MNYLNVRLTKQGHCYFCALRLETRGRIQTRQLEVSVTKNKNVQLLLTNFTTEKGNTFQHDYRKDVTVASFFYRH